MSRKSDFKGSGSRFFGSAAILVMMLSGCQEVPTPLNQTEATGSSTDATQAGEPDSHPESGQDPEPSTDKPEQPTSERVDWIDKGQTLFNGDSLADWDEINFGGEGDITLKDGLLEFQAGDPFTGISSTRQQLPKTNYEISLEARKMDGIDFFCGLTFPVDDSHCTLIVGGWGGATVGLSCIDGKDASSNETCTYMKFEKEQWYKIRIRVQPGRISVWIDDQEVVDQDIEGHKISLRGDTELCKPLGLCSFMTVAEFRNARIRQFSPLSDPQKPKQDASQTTGQDNDES